jgi:hypothetical protein
MSSSLLWKPFQSRFSTLLERLNKHQQWFETEANIQQHELIVHHHESFLDYLKETEKRSEKEAYKEAADERNWNSEYYPVYQSCSSPN